METLTLKKPQYKLCVQVKSQFLPHQSVPSEHRFVFSYTVTVKNIGKLSACLISRHWIVTDGNGKTREIKGRGVLGEQPVIESGKTYQYTSGTVLPTPVGSMHGAYQMQAANGLKFKVTIPPFSLAVPEVIH